MEIYKCTINKLFQNGYPARRRSLVDDARFETIVVKQTKQSVLEEARQLANGKSTMMSKNDEQIKDREETKWLDLQT